MLVVVVQPCICQQGRLNRGSGAHFVSLAGRQFGLGAGVEIILALLPYLLGLRLEAVVVPGVGMRIDAATRTVRATCGACGRWSTTPTESMCAGWPTSDQVVTKCWSP